MSPLATWLLHKVVGQNSNRKKIIVSSSWLQNYFMPIHSLLLGWRYVCDIKMPELSCYERMWKSWPNYSLLHEKYFQDIFILRNTAQMHRLLWCMVGPFLNHALLRAIVWIHCTPYTELKSCLAWDRAAIFRVWLQRDWYAWERFLLDTSILNHIYHTTFILDNICKLIQYIRIGRGQLLVEASRVHSEQRPSLYLNLICIYQGTGYKNYKKVLRIKS